MGLERIAILDCDEVLCTLRDTIVAECVPSLQGVEVPIWDYFSVVTPEELVAMRTRMKDPLFWRKLPVEPGAQAGVQKLRADGFHIVVATAPYRSNKMWGYERYGWLAKHFDIDPDDVLIGNRKHLIDGDLFIDDRPEHIVTWGPSHPNSLVVIKDRSYNRDIIPSTNTRRMANWGEIDCIIEAYHGRQTR